MSGDISNLLVQHMIKCYLLANIPKNAPERILQSLSNRILVLSDIELRPDDFPPISRFLSSKQALNWLECIVLNKTSEKNKRNKRLALFKNGTYSSLNLEGCRMLRVVIEFISRSINLQRLEIDSINISPIIISSLGVALTDHHQGFKILTLRNIPLGDEGLRLLTPHLSKCRIQCLTLEKCHLTDDSLPFLTSIIKSQESIQENNFWNSNLRNYPIKEGDQLRDSREKRSSSSSSSSSSSNTGLILIDLSYNKLSNKGGFTLAHLLSENKWILGLNLSFNRIEENGIDRLLRDLLSPDRLGCALISLHIRGNPGCDQAIMELLSHMATTSLRHPIFSNNKKNSDIMGLLLKWINEQRDMKMPTKKRKPSKDKNNNDLERNKQINQNSNGNSNGNDTDIIGPDDNYDNNNNNNNNINNYNYNNYDYNDDDKDNNINAHNSNNDGDNHNNHNYDEENDTDDIDEDDDQSDNDNYNNNSNNNGNHRYDNNYNKKNSHQHQHQYLNGYEKQNNHYDNSNSINRGEYVSRDILGVESDDKNYSKPSTFQQEHDFHDFGFQGYPVNNNEVLNENINGRPPSRLAIRPRNDFYHHQQYQQQQVQQLSDLNRKNHSFQEIPQQNSSNFRTSPTRLVSSLDDFHLQPKRGRNTTSDINNRNRVRSHSAEGITFQRPHQKSSTSNTTTYMNPTKSFNSYRQSIKDDYIASNIRALYLRDYHGPISNHLNHHHPYQNSNSTYHNSHSNNRNNNNNSNNNKINNQKSTYHETRGRKISPYPKQSRQSIHRSHNNPPRRIYSPPPKKKSSNVQNESEQFNLNYDKHHNQDHNQQNQYYNGDERKVDNESRKKRSNSNNKKNRKNKLDENELLIQQLGQGVMSELTKVVDTVSTDLRLVSEQLRNISNSMSESMMLSFVKDPDTSIMNNSFNQIKNNNNNNNNNSNKGEKLVLSINQSPSPPPSSSPPSRERSPERSKSRETRYKQSEQLNSDQESQDIDLKTNVQDDVLTEMIRVGLRQKLMSLIPNSLQNSR